MLFVPTLPQPHEYVVKAGRYLTVEFYYTKDGSIPGESFYSSSTDQEKRRLLHIVEYLTDQPPGKPLPKTMFNVEDAAQGIYAIKPFSGRYLGFFASGGKFIIAEAYSKQTQTLGRREKRQIEKAVERKHDYNTRSKAKEYYESE